MDNAIRNDWNIDTARLNVQLLEPETPQLRRVLEDYVHELKALPDFDPRLKPRIYVQFETLNNDTLMRIYMDHAVSMHGLESFPNDSMQSPFCGVFFFDGMDVSIWQRKSENPCFENLFRRSDSVRSVDYAYDFSIKKGRVRMVNNFYWSYNKNYVLKDGAFVLLGQKYLRTHKSIVKSGGT